MVKQLSFGIEITVDVEYKKSIVPQQANQNIFMYKIVITNNNEFTVKLLRRKWFIFDAKEFMNVVDGPGVVGKTPELISGASFSYSSWTTINSDMGYMEGFYVMKNMETDEEFEAKIPRFILVLPQMMN